VAAAEDRAQAALGRARAARQRADEARERLEAMEPTPQSSRDWAETMRRQAAANQAYATHLLRTSERRHRTRR
jgi:hypothetical protein